MTKALRSVDFARVNAAALPRLPAVCSRLLPDGRREGAEWVAKNPIRLDHRAGSFKVNLRSGRWADFATKDRGGDPVSLVAYIAKTSQSNAARLLGRMLGIETKGGKHD